MKIPCRLGEPLPRRVAVFRALQLGDLLCTIPAWRALRMALPQAEIMLVGLASARSLAARFAHYLDEFCEFPGYPGLPEQAPRGGDFPAFLTFMQAKQFDLVLQMHGNGTITNPLIGLFGARFAAGFFVPGGYCPDAQRFLPYPIHEPEIWRHLRLLEFLGIPLQGHELEFPLREEDKEQLHALAEAEQLSRQGYVCIHAGARAPARRWPPEHFAAVADGLASRGFCTVLTGTAEEACVTRAVRDAMAAPVLDLTGKTNLGTLAALLDEAHVLICNDTGVSHLAAALRIPSVVIFHGISELQGWPPLNRQLHRVLCRIPSVTPDEVLAEVDDLLRKERRQRAQSSTVDIGPRMGSRWFSVGSSKAVHS
ncbi:MAG TPA: glycosyltransferase family 9 protein [Gemmataceae bacterium]|nr:glycosyltransferase family 9 protein [Gemmataceae bacterium]